MAEHNEWDVEKLKSDIQKYSELRDNLASTVKKMEEAKVNADKTLKNIANEDNIWKDRCLLQQEDNQKLQEELETHQRNLRKLRKESEISPAEGSESGAPTKLDNMSDLALRQLQKKLEKDKTEVEWKLKEYGWRLDQASAALCRAKDEKATILTQIGHAVVKLKDMQKPSEERVAKSYSTH